MANNFRWFDQPAQFTPGGMEDYVAGRNQDMGYQRSQQGLLSLLGAGISGGIAPFVGDNQWLERRTKQQMEQAQADNEFRAALLKLRQQGEESQQSKDFQNKYLQVLAGQQTNPPLLANEQQPSLADAFPVKEQKLLTKQGFSTSGKPFTSQTVDPEYQKSLELRNANIKEASDIVPSIEKYLQGANLLKEAIANVKDVKPGFGSKYLSAGKNWLAEAGNAPWWTNYNTAFEQQYLPTLRALESSKVVSDKETANLIASLGDKTLPNEAKLKALESLNEKVRVGANAKLSGYGINKDKFKEMYPNSGTFVFGLKKSNNKTGSISKDNLFEGL